MYIRVNAKFTAFTAVQDTTTWQHLPLHWRSQYKQHTVSHGFDLSRLNSNTTMLKTLNYYPVPGIVFDQFLCLYLSFVTLLARLRENSWTVLHKIFREGAEWPWDDLITFLVNSETPCDAAMRNMGGRVCWAFALQLVFLVMLNINDCYKIYCGDVDDNS